MQTTFRDVILLLAVSVLATGCSQKVSFNSDVMPILTANCQECHKSDGEGFVKSGFSINDYDSVMKGTKFGPVIVPGNSDSSSLFRLINHLADLKIQMPPHHYESLSESRREALTEKEIVIIQEWIDQGAKNT